MNCFKIYLFLENKGFKCNLKINHDTKECEEVHTDKQLKILTKNIEINTKDEKNHVLNK